MGITFLIPKYYKVTPFEEDLPLWDRSSWWLEPQRDRCCSPLSPVRVSYVHSVRESIQRHGCFIAEAERGNKSRVGQVGVCGLLLKRIVILHATLVFAIVGQCRVSDSIRVLRRDTGIIARLRKDSFGLKSLHRSASKFFCEFTARNAIGYWRRYSATVHTWPIDDVGKWYICLH